MDVVEKIIRDVAELPDRTSPADWPDALIVTSAELKQILDRYLSKDVDDSGMFGNFLA